MTGRQRLRMLLNMVNLSTPAGLLLATLTRTRLEQGPAGLILGTDYKPRLPQAGAFTVGNVVLYRAERSYIDSRPELLGHEARHSTQYAWCLGLPFFPLYAGCTLYSLWRTGNPGSRNFFERNAGLAAGGYPELPGKARFRRRTLSVPAQPESIKSSLNLGVRP